MKDFSFGIKSIILAAESKQFLEFVKPGTRQFLEFLKSRCYCVSSFIINEYACRMLGKGYIIKILDQKLL